MLMKNLFFLMALTLALQASGAEVDADSALQRRQHNFDRFAQGFPQERVYLHFDNTSYYKGEHIWYKAYVVRDDNLHHTNLSRILYVELLNPIGYPVETQKLLIENGQAHGSFELKDTLNAGFYEVRAYTTWMLNFTTGDSHGWHRLYTQSAKRRYGERFQRYLQGNAGIFSRVFPIYERVDSGRYAVRRMPRQSKATATMVTPDKDKLYIDFYPEGGNMVRDVPTRVAFQAHNTEGRTLNVAGALIRRGDSIGYFKSEYAGRGVFSVTPDSLDAEDLVENLQLKLTYQGKNYKFNLPKAKKRGYSLNVYSNEKQLRTIVARNAQTKGQLLGLNVTSRGQTLYYDMLDLRQKPQTSVVLDKKILQTGVNIVTLFTEEGRVLAQRQVFVNNHDRDGWRLQDVSGDDKPIEAEPYRQVTLDYQLVDAAGKPVRASHDFSIAVTDGDSRETTYDDATALSYLLLGSEVKGFIPHPAYYFEADDAEHNGALDLLLMVQGWTRYDYEQMMGDEPFEPMLPVERGLNFSGRLWDDHDYASHRFWKLQNKKPYWVYSELFFEGDTVDVNRVDKSLDFPVSDLLQEKREGLKFLAGEAQIDSTGTFHLNMQPFYGKGRLALVLNKQPLSEIGELKGGIAGHNFQWNTIRRPYFLLGKRIEPLNQFSPLPKEYGYYETAALTDPFDYDMFRKGFMAVPKDNVGRLIYYDAVSQSYILPDIKKNQRRRWSDFSDVSPVCVMDVKDMMAWLSNIYGDIQDFKFRENDPYGGHGGPVNTDANLYGDAGNWFNHEDFVNQMMLEDAQWMDQQFRTHSYTEATMDYIQAMNNTYDIETDDIYFTRLAEMLYVFGLDGMNSTYVDALADGGMMHYTTATGDSALLPKNLHFFPVNENFRTLQLYADIDNRRLIHRQGRYHETVFGYETQRANNTDHPLTSIFNFLTDNTYDNSHPLAEFLGYRINFQGFTRPAEFYCPDYDWEPEPEETDYRRTVYWNPSARTDEQGRVHLEFFNNGFSQRLAVSAEGIITDGTAITTVTP